MYSSSAQKSRPSEPMTGDLAAALASGRRLLALDIERGSDATLARSNLVDAELAAGNAEHAARAGAELVQVLQSTRHEYGLTCARINLLAAQLALDDHASARPVAEAVWAKAPAFELQHVVSALARWVEQGVAPTAIIATKYDDKGAITRQRPVCAYPQIAVYRGSGDENAAGNFACATPNADQLPVNATDILLIQNSLRQRDVLGPRR